MRFSFALLIIFFYQVSSAQLFVEEHISCGVFNHSAGQYGNGISLYDWDEDGLDDMVILTDSLPPSFYHNINGQFEQVYFQGIDVRDEIKSVLWTDINNDNLPDLSFNSLNGGVKLYLNTGDFIFIDISLSAGVQGAPNDQGYGISWCDFNNDSYLDLFVANYNSTSNLGRNRLYKNNGDLTFTNVSSEAGLTDNNEPTFMGVWFDYNNDNLPDLLVINDRIVSPNYLYQNMGDGTFMDVSILSGSHVFMDSMTGTVGDFNNDTWIDYYVTNTQEFGNKLFRNNGNNSFDEISASSNTQLFQWCWGAVWIDYDNDMVQDLFVVNDYTTIAGVTAPHMLLKNVNGSFDLLSNTGFGSSLGPTFSTAKADVNNDGLLDLVTHSHVPLGTEIWFNRSSETNFIKVLLKGIESNSNGIGARLTLYSGGVTQTRFVMCGEQYLSQNTQWQHFGLGATEVIDSLKVQWPSGQIDILIQPEINSNLVVVEGSSLTNQINVQGQIILCRYDSVLLDAGEWDTYLWNTGETTQTIYGTAPNSYSVETSQGPFIVNSSSIQLFESESLVPEVSAMNPCSGEQNGSITLSFTSDSIEVNWDWNNEVGYNLLDLIAGTYTYTAMNNLGCDYTGSVTLVDEEPAIDVDLQLFPQTDDCLGLAQVKFIHSAIPGSYEYSWQLLDNSFTTVLGSGTTTEDYLCIPNIQQSYLDLKISNENQCFIRDTLFVGDIPLNSSKIITNEFVIFPNPFVDYLKLRTSSMNINRVNILDLTGRLLKSVPQSSSGFYIDTADLPNGFYQIQVISRNNNITTFKAIKSK
jgi:hypothetical protein